MTTRSSAREGLGSVIAPLLASGGETLRLASADQESTRALAGRLAVGGDLHDLVVGGAQARSLIGRDRTH
jgi:hypothetical protein